MSFEKLSATKGYFPKGELKFSSWYDSDDEDDQSEISDWPNDFMENVKQSVDEAHNFTKAEEE